RYAPVGVTTAFGAGRSPNRIGSEGSCRRADHASNRWHDRVLDRASLPVPAQRIAGAFAAALRKSPSTRAVSSGGSVPTLSQGRSGGLTLNEIERGTERDAYPPGFRVLLIDDDIGAETARGRAAGALIDSLQAAEAAAPDPLFSLMSLRPECPHLTSTSV